MEAITRPKSPWLRLLWAQPYTAAFLLMYIGMFVPFMTLKRDWENCLLVEAVRLCEGDTIYGHDDLYPYPPLPALLAVPFAYLPFQFSQAVFYSLNMICLYLMIRWAWVLTGGNAGPNLKIEFRDSQLTNIAPWREHMIMLLGAACGLILAWNCLAHHQLDLFVGAAMIGGCLALARSRTYLAALCFGLAATIKGPALLWGPYLLWRGRWKEAVCVFAVFVGLNLLPTLVVPAQLERLPDHSFLFVEWAERFLQPMGHSSDYPHFWYTESNQSLIGCGYRWFCTTWDWSDDRFEQQLPIAQPASPWMLKGFFLTCAALLVVGTMLVQRRKFAGENPPHGPGSLSLECGMVLMLMLLLSPMTSKAHCGTLLVPAFAVARAAVYQRSRVLTLILTMVMMAVLCTQNFMGEYVVCVAMWHGAITWAALLLLVGCGCSLRRVRKNDAAERANQRARSCPPPPNVEQGYQWQKWARRLVTRLTRPAAVKEEEHR